MDIESIRLYCLSIKGAEESFPFDDETLVFKVMGKIFALMGLENAHLIALKCDPDYAIELREEYNAIEPAFHMNKKYWIQVDFTSGLDDNLIKKLIDHSLEEVYKKFTKKMKEEYDRL